MEKVTWKRTRSVHCFDLGTIFLAYGINPDNFKKKRHAKKFFKKYIQPIFKNSDVKSQQDNIVANTVEDAKKSKEFTLKKDSVIADAV